MAQASDTWRGRLNEVRLDLYGHLQTAGISQAQARDVVGALGAREGDRLLDACCGQGRPLQ